MIRSHTLLLCLLLFFSSVALRAEVKKDKPWKNEAELAFVSNNGNSKTSTLSAKDVFTYNWTQWTLELMGSTLKAESEESTIAEKHELGEKLSFNISDHDYLFEKFLWDKDRFAGIDGRYDLQFGYGRKLIQATKHFLKGEIGGGYINEDRIGEPQNDFFSGRGYAKYEFKISETSNFSQDFEYLHNFEDAGDYRINTETAVISTLASYMSLKFSYKINHVGDPPGGFGKTDTTTMASLIFSH